jgi:uncharacterized membrane protein
MNGFPLHPALTHLPLGLALVSPFALLWALWNTRREGDRRPWLLPVALQVLVLAGGIVAYQTGSREEERVERLVPEAALEAHEHRAQAFLAAASAAALLSLGALALRGRAVRWAGGFAAAAGFATLGLGLATGHAGGTLVFRHGAAAASAPGPAPAGLPEAPGHD